MKTYKATVISLFAVLAPLSTQGCKLNHKSAEVKSFTGKIGSKFIYLVDIPMQVKPSVDPKLSVDLGNTQQTLSGMFSTMGVCYSLVETTTAIEDFTSPENLALAVPWPLKNAYPVRILDFRMKDGIVYPGLITALLADPRTHRLGEELITSTHGLIDAIKKAGLEGAASFGAKAAKDSILTPSKRMTAENLSDFGMKLTDAPIAHNMRISAQNEKVFKKLYPESYKGLGEVEKYFVSIQKVKPQDGKWYERKIEVATYFAQDKTGKIKAIANTADASTIKIAKNLIGGEAFEVFGTLKKAATGLTKQSGSKFAAASIQEVAADLKKGAQSSLQYLRNAGGSFKENPGGAIKSFAKGSLETVDNVCLKGTGMMKIACAGAAIFATASIAAEGSNLLGTNRLSSSDLDNAAQGMSDPKLNTRLSEMLQNISADHKSTEEELIGLKEVIEKLASQNPLNDGPCLPPSGALEATVTAAVATDPTLPSAGTDTSAISGMSEGASDASAPARPAPKNSAPDLASALAAAAQETPTSPTQNTQTTQPQETPTDNNSPSKSQVPNSGF